MLDNFSFFMLLIEPKKFFNAITSSMNQFFLMRLLNQIKKNCHEKRYVRHFTNIRKFFGAWLICPVSDKSVRLIVSDAGTVLGTPSVVGLKGSPVCVCGSLSV